MEQHTLKNVNNCWNTNIYPYLDTSGGQNPNLELNVVNFFNTSVLQLLYSAKPQNCYNTTATETIKK